MKTTNPFQLLKWIKLAGLLLTGCSIDNEALTPSPVASVSLYHASPDAPPLNIVVDHRIINNYPVRYADYSSYLNFFTGKRTFRLTPANISNVLVDTSLTLSRGKKYSLFIINRLPDLGMWLIKDSLYTLPPNKAGLRFIHLSPDAPALDLIVDNQAKPLFASQSYKLATSFITVSSGKQTFRMKLANGSDTVLTLPDAVLEPGCLYSLMVQGLYNPSSENANILSARLVRTAH